MRVVVIPAFNEALSIPDVVDSVKTFVNHVIVVNDCSTDNTSELAHDHGAFVLNNSVNLGYDASIRLGLLYAYELGAMSVLTLDGDGQHINVDISKFFAFADYLDCHILIGSRASHPRISEIFISFLSQKLFGLFDITSGFKYYTRPVLDRCLSPCDYDSIGTSVLFSALGSGFLVKEMSINICSRQNGPSRIGSSIQIELKLVYAFLRGCIIVFCSKFNKILSLT